MRTQAAAGIVLALAACVSAGVPVYVMLPLDAVGHDNTLTDPEGLRADMTKLKQAGVAGVMTDVWFGLCEPSPQAYNFTGYVELARMAQSVGVHVQAVMSFHKVLSGRIPAQAPHLPELYACAAVRDERRGVQHPAAGVGAPGLQRVVRAASAAPKRCSGSHSTHSGPSFPSPGTRTRRAT